VNFKRQSAHSTGLPQLQHFGTSKAEMTVRDKNQMIDQFDFGVFAGGLQDWPISRCGRKTAFPW